MNKIRMSFWTELVVEKEDEVRNFVKLHGTRLEVAF